MSRKLIQSGVGRNTSPTVSESVLVFVSEACNVMMFSKEPSYTNLIHVFWDVNDRIHKYEALPLELSENYVDRSDDATTALI